MKKVLVYEPQCTGSAHELFNAGVTYSLLKTSEDIQFFCETEHYKAITSLLAQNKITVAQLSYHKISLIDTSSRVIEFCWKLGQTLRILNYASRNQIDQIVFLSISSCHLFVLKLLILFFRKIKIVLVLHGVVEELSHRPRPTSLNYLFWFGWIYPLWPTAQLTYLALSPVVGDKLQQLYPRVKLVSIDHPMLPKTFVLPSQNAIVKFGSVGNINTRRGAGNIIQVCSSLMAQGLEFAYIVLGYLDCPVTLNSKLKVLSRRFSRAEIDQEMQAIDYVLIPYPRGLYNYTISGVFFDAVYYNRPVIALQSDQMVYYFNKFGNIGHLCASLAELTELLAKLVRTHHNNSLEYAEQLANLQKAKKTIFLENMEWFGSL